MLYVWAVQRPGPHIKVGYGNVTTREGTGVVVHSAEGSLSSALAVLESEKQVSWHFTVAKDGSVYQHYDTGQICWHAGPKANPYYIGIECEGVAGQPVEGPQADALCELLRWLHEGYGWPQAQRGLTLFEHNEFMPTSCPSGRIPWDYVLTALEPPPLEPGQPQAPVLPPVSDDASGAAIPGLLNLMMSLHEAFFILWRDGNLDHLSPPHRQTLASLFN